MRAASLIRSSITSLAVPACLRPKRPVPGDVEMRVERIRLEDHGDAALGRRQMVDNVAADADPAGGLVLEPGDDPQKRGLAAARGPEQHDELAVLDVEVDALEDIHLAEGLADGVDLELCHDDGPWMRMPEGGYFTAPEVMPRMSCLEKTR